MLASLRMPNRVLWWVTGAASLCLILVLQVPLLRDLFHFAPLDRDPILLAAAAGLASIAWFELFKAVRKPRLS
jgi:Ca2+-transporting ATPase